MGLYIEGSPVNAQAFQPDYTNLDYTSEYLSLFADGREHRIIEYSHFSTGYAIYCFRLNDLLQERRFIDVSRKGNMKLKVKFDHTLLTPVTVIVYGLQSTSMQVNRDRQVFLEQ